MSRIGGAAGLPRLPANATNLLHLK